MLKRYWPAIVIALILLAAPVVGVWSSDNFGYCIDHNGQYPTAQNDKNKSPAVSVPSGLKLYWNCAGGFANDNGIAITSLATVLLTIVTGGLVWLGFLQFSTTRAQLRAYIYPDQMGLFPGSPQPSVYTVFKNFGQTPAPTVVSWAQIDIIEPRHENTLVIPKMEKKFPMALGAGGTFSKTTSYPRALNAQEIADIKSGVRAIFYYGRAEYTDAFGRTRFTNFRVFYVGVFPVSAGMSFSTCDTGNDAS
jgi:hypothetical protein